MISQRKGLFAALAIALCLSAGVARADVYCTGPVSEYLVMSDGTLMVNGSWRNGWTALCNTHGTWRGITTEVCFSWLAVVGSSKNHNKPLGVYYTGNVDCSTLPIYNDTPAPHYVRMGP